MGAYQLAFVACEAMGAGGADLAMVVDGSLLDCVEAGGANRTTL